MSDPGLSLSLARARPPWRTRLNHLLANPKFQAWAARFPLTRGLVRREGQALFDIVAGFAHAQVLMALVELDLSARLLDGPAPLARLARACGVPEDRMRVLVRAGVALNLLRLDAHDTVHMTRQLAALHGVPGLAEMILHHKLLYRDLAEPAEFFAGRTETELATFWPYVFGAGAQADPATVRRYSDLMAQSQQLVIDDTLATVSLTGAHRLLDIGGGTGGFALAACAANPALQATVLDLPQVAPAARQRIDIEGQAGRIRFCPGSFRDDPLPKGHDAISLIRVLFDHDDGTVRALLAKILKALPDGGRLIVSEPMTGGARPTRAGDAYFALYCMAMRTGQARAQRDIARMMAEAGFARIETPRPRRDFVTSVVTAHKL